MSSDAGHLVARSRVIKGRNRFGQFAAAIKDAESSAVERTVNEGARASRRLAPVGKHRERYAARPGYVPLNKSIRTHTSGTSGYWYSIAPHALYVEYGTNAHLIKGHLRFYWRGGLFYWKNPEFGPVGSGKVYENWDDSGVWVRHPGTHAQPFLRPAYDEVVKRQMMRILRDEMRKKGL